MNEQKKKPISILLTVILISALLTVCLELGLGYLRPDTPGSIPKHLIHFAIMFILLGGATLLCLFCPPFKKLWAWLDKNIMTQETRPIAIDIIYAVIAGLMLLHHFYVIVYYPTTLPTGATRFAPVWIVFAAITIFLSKSWREINFRVAIIFLIFTFERLFIKKLSILGNDIVYFASAIYAMLFCANVFSVLRPAIHKPFLRTLCALWTISTLTMCAIGLYSSWTGSYIENPGDAWARILDGRLRIFSPASITAGYLASGVIMALIGFAISNHKSVKILYLFAILVSTLTNSLTDSRSSFLAISLVMSGMICLGLWSIHHNQAEKNAPIKKVIIMIILLILCFSFCIYLTVEGQRVLGSKFIEIRDDRGFFPTAIAEESTVKPTVPPQIQEFIQREVWFSDEANISETLNGRYEIWGMGLKYIFDNPETLLYGLSIDGSVATIVGREDHSHNIYLQSLLEGGIPALVLFLLFVVYGIYHSFRIWRQPNVPYWQLILPLPMFAVLLWEIAECLSHFSFGHPPMTLLWFFLGATIAVSKSLGKVPKSPETSAKSAE